LLCAGQLAPSAGAQSAPSAGATGPAATSPQESGAAPSQTQSQQDREKSLSDQGVFVFKKDVDEVLLHATVQDDKNHIVTNLDRNAFTFRSRWGL
jgi:hypothetical protein